MFFVGEVKNHRFPPQGAANPIMPACGDGVANVRIFSEKMGVVYYTKWEAKALLRAYYLLLIFKYGWGGGAGWH